MSLFNYESFNARNLSPEEVAGTFIPSKDYEDLWHNDHTVVLGPRGSGKTTLFKMLTVQAIYSWNTPFALELRKSRVFTAIYVPTDMHWHHQLKHGEEQFAGYPKLQQAVSRCAVTTSILLAIVKTFQARILRESTSNLDAETFVAKHLINEWKLEKAIPTYDMIIVALKGRVNQVRAMVNAQSLRFASSTTTTTLPDFYHLDYFAAMDYACSIFDAVYKLGQSGKWALCLDEMELAPEWLQTLAMSQVRSSEQDYLIKLSTSPIPLVAGTTGARPKHDYELISIWNYSGRDSTIFAKQLSTSVLSRKFNQNVSPERFLGKSEIITDNENELVRYEQGSSEWRLFKEVASWDKSFSKLLTDNNLDPNDPSTTDIGLRDSLLRKAKPIAIFRSAFLKQIRTGRLWMRSRKIAGVYFGTHAIFRISDGNPRRLIGIMNDLAAKADVDATGQPLPLSPIKQDEVLSKASAQFFGYVHALPGGTAMLDNERIDLVTILKAIATFFRQGLLGNEFILDPKGSFIVDSNLSEQIVELLRLGVYHGAIVHVDPLPDTIETTVVGKRFRLSYMLAPVSRLPLTLYSEVSLTRILKSSARMRVKRVFPLIEQSDRPQQTNLPI